MKQEQLIQNNETSGFGSLAEEWSANFRDEIYVADERLKVLVSEWQSLTDELQSQERRYDNLLEVLILNCSNIADTRNECKVLETELSGLEKHRAEIQITSSKHDTIMSSTVKCLKTNTSDVKKALAKLYSQKSRNISILAKLL